MIRRADRGLLVLAVCLVLAVGLARCGVGGPSQPDSVSSTGAQLQGSFVGAGTSFGLSAFASTQYEGITVTVMEDPSIETTVGAGGSFTLRGLPQGSFTLVFSRDGMPLGELEFSTVKPNMEILISVELTPSGSVRLLAERRTGIGDGGYEIEGLVTDMPAVGPGDKEGTIVVNGFTIYARPGQTAIREGNRDRSIYDIRVDTRVHVKAVGESSVAVLAQEIKIQQNDEADDDDDDTGTQTTCDLEANGKITICHYPPGNPMNEKTLSISPNAWPAHLAHGDKCGRCEENAVLR